ncbi:isoprenoid biosynthesis glyoxalase ElbB [Sansalvadorimonas verongulae]|uniref:isoprenoid biosynthesis glyoxalase ElbB n=1 Tax=Sansalvadorimonas verongulae TaxID=2172824 RepID=UPI0012BD0CBC|nr:isoprenoid biosynthesis glyoxalase ElbB [Sansalvadorimonas verongulae]MTI14409.1 isoprenoid biosynthesis glyoxalase ElbB [Sansalvadorimonas verongulae]
MNKKIAVILSGCGVYDGSEIYESVLTLLRIDQNGASYQCFAPDDNQHHVVNHLSGEETAESRNMLEEAARLARGEIKPLTKLQADDFDGLIIPGGFGAAKNLCDFAFKGKDVAVREDVQAAVQDFKGSEKPVGLMCIAPVMSAKLFGDGVQCTIGNDPDTASALEATGAVHKSASAHEVVVDKGNKLVTTPAYMMAGSISEASTGIFRLVDSVLEMS